MITANAIEPLLEAMEIAHEALIHYYDTVDRADGTPGPNKAMAAGTALVEAMAECRRRLANGKV